MYYFDIICIAPLLTRSIRFIQGTRVSELLGEECSSTLAKVLLKNPLAIHSHRSKIHSIILKYWPSNLPS